MKNDILFKIGNFLFLLLCHLMVFLLLLLLLFKCVFAEVPNNVIVGYGKSFDNDIVTSLRITGLSDQFCFGEINHIGNSMLSSIGVGYRFSRRVSIGTSIGYFHQGKSNIDLGSDIEFYSFLEYKLGFLGMSLSHISNAHLSKKNPGINLFKLFLTY